MAKAEFKLYYWPEMTGRGEFIRILFHETNTPYEEVFDGKTFEDVKEFGYGQKGKNFAFPNLEHNGMFISQTPVICRYLANKLDGGRLWPVTEKEQLAAEMLNHGVTDAVKEGELLWHPFDFNGTHLSQREKAKSFMEYYTEKRLTKWLTYFERSLKESMANNGGKLFFVGENLTYVDLLIFLFLEGNLQICPESFKKVETSSLIKFYESIKERPHIKAWLNNEKRQKHDELGPPCF